MFAVALNLGGKKTKGKDCRYDFDFEIEMYFCYFLKNKLFYLNFLILK